MTISGWVFMISVGFNAAIRSVLSQLTTCMIVFTKFKSYKIENVSIQFTYPHKNMWILTFYTLK